MASIGRDALDGSRHIDYICTMVQLSKQLSSPQLACQLEKFLSPRFFKALSNRNRIGLLVTLASTAEARTVGELARGTNVDMSVVSRHLAILREAGFIECQKSGKEVWYSVRAREVAQMLREIADCLMACCPVSDKKERHALTR